MFLDENYWSNKYENKTTGWDIGKTSTPLKTYFDQLTNKDLKILIPGCGNSHEAEYLHTLGFKNVFVVDLTKIALQNLKNRVPTFPEKNLLNADFFDINMDFDLIIEQTFFCAINKSLRPSYAKKMNTLLNKNGKLVGLLFDDLLNEDHPPFGGNKKEYLTYFEPYFNIEIMEPSYNSVSKRAGRELFIKLVKQ
jgi:hypothetical protein